MKSRQIARMLGFAKLIVDASLSSDYRPFPPDPPKRRPIDPDDEVEPLPLPNCRPVVPDAEEPELPIRRPNELGTEELRDEGPRIVVVRGNENDGVAAPL